MAWLEHLHHIPYNDPMYDVYGVWLAARYRSCHYTQSGLGISPTTSHEKCTPKWTAICVTVSEIILGVFHDDIMSLLSALFLIVFEELQRTAINILQLQPQGIFIA